MTFTHEELLSAVREAGRDRESFTCADVRGCLGISTKDRSQLARFHARFRAFQKEAGDEIEKVASNCYRLNKRVAKRARAERPRASAAATRGASEPTLAAAAVAIEMSAEAPAPQAHEEKLELQVETLEAAASPIDMLVELQVETLEAAASPIDVLVELQVETFDAPASSIDTLELSRDMLEAALEELELPLPLPLPLPTPQTVVARLEPSIDMLDETLHMHAAHDMRHAHDMHDTLELTDAMLESSVEISDADADALSAAAVSGRFGSELLQPAVRRWRDRGQWLGRRVVEIFSRA